MKKCFISFLCIVTSCFCSGKNQNSKPEIEIIKIHHDSINQAIKNGPLSFLSDPDFLDWIWPTNVNGVSVDGIMQRSLPSHLRKGSVMFMEKIRMKKPHGIIYYLPAKKSSSSD